MRVHEPGALLARLSARRRRLLRCWFAAGAAAGLVTGACSTALLLSELWVLLLDMLPAPATAVRQAAAAAASNPRIFLSSLSKRQLPLCGLR